MLNEDREYNILREIFNIDNIGDSVNWETTIK